MTFHRAFDRLCWLFSDGATPTDLETAARACYAVASRIEASYLFAVLSYFEMNTEWLEEAMYADAQN